ncbi:hypothetical protein ES708_25674 [subsurface metagenome]
MLVGVELLHLFLNPDLDGHYLLAENAVLYRRQSPLVTEQGQLVLLLPGDAVLIGDVLRGQAHMVIIEYLPQPVIDHAVHHLGVEHPGPPPGAGQVVRHGAHVLHPPGDNDLGIARLDGLGGQSHRFHPRSTNLVHRVGVHLFRNARVNPRLASGILPLPRLEDVTHDNLVHPHLF